MKKLIITLAACLGLATLLAPPAAAGECTDGVCGNIYHYTPDDGFDNAIPIRCDFGNPDSKHYLAEGEHSGKYCRDTDEVYVWADSEIWCLYYSPSGPEWIKKFDAIGWHKINDIWNDGLGCTYRRD